MTDDAPVGRFAITVDWPTGKDTVEVSGLGVFRNHETTELTEEQVWLWFNRRGAQPLASFPEGISISEVDPKTPLPKAQPTAAEGAEKTPDTKKDGA